MVFFLSPNPLPVLPPLSQPRTLKWAHLRDILHQPLRTLAFPFHLLVEGNSLVLHCASLLRTIFTSLAREHERVNGENVRDFPQAKLDSEINVPFLLNEHGDPRLLF